MRGWALGFLMALFPVSAFAGEWYYAEGNGENGAWKAVYLQTDDVEHADKASFTLGCEAGNLQFMFNLETKNLPSDIDAVAVFDQNKPIELKFHRTASEQKRTTFLEARKPTIVQLVSGMADTKLLRVKVIDYVSRFKLPSDDAPLWKAVAPCGVKPAS